MLIIIITTTATINNIICNINMHRQQYHHQILSPQRFASFACFNPRLCHLGRAQPSVHTISSNCAVLGDRAPHIAWQTCLPLRTELHATALDEQSHVASDNRGSDGPVLGREAASTAQLNHGQQGWNCQLPLAGGLSWQLSVECVTSRRPVTLHLRSGQPCLLRPQVAATIFNAKRHMTDPSPENRCWRSKASLAEAWADHPNQGTGQRRTCLQINNELSKTC